VSINCDTCIIKCGNTKQKDNNLYIVINKYSSIITMTTLTEQEIFFNKR